jgi:hypothetical protein
LESRIIFDFYKKIVYNIYRKLKNPLVQEEFNEKKEIYSMNTFMNGLKNATNYTYTENGALTHVTTRSDLLDMFAMGGAMRTRSNEDVILMFQKAYQENPVYALKCLFYLRDVRGGQGERRFFRVCMQWLAEFDTDAARRNLKYIPEFGRWDDLYLFVNTPLEADAFAFMKEQLALDVQCKTPSLLAKWLKSENTSSYKSRILGDKTRQYFGMTHKQYRKTLSILRERINIVERLMSENRWDEIEFDKIPSRAGLIYKNAFARHDLERMQSEKNVQSYADFAKDASTTVNAKALYPYEVVSKAIDVMNCHYYWGKRTDVALDDTDRLMVNKYWDNLTDYFNGQAFNGLAVVDTSGSMTGYEASAPINVAISLGLYCAERAKGPFANHYISFASRPQLIQTDGVDFCDKVARIYRTNLCDNTNIEAVFDLLLNTAITNHCSQDDLPQNIIVISDMEFDYAINLWGSSMNSSNAETLLERIAEEWKAYGYDMPHLIFWNVEARQANIPMLGNGRISYVSGMSPSIFETILSGKTGYDLMMEKLNSSRYDCIQ